MLKIQLKQKINSLLKRWKTGLENLKDPKIFIECLYDIAANKYSSAGHHEHQNQETTSQIKFVAVIIK